MAQKERKNNHVIYGGFWIRVAALLIDTLITLLPLRALNAIFLALLLSDKYPTFMSTLSPPPAQEILMDPRELFIQVLASLLMGLCYFWLIQSYFQGTLGKR